MQLTMHMRIRSMWKFIKQFFNIRESLYLFICLFDFLCYVISEGILLMLYMDDLFLHKDFDFNIWQKYAEDDKLMSHFCFK